MVSKLKKYDPGCSSRIPDPDAYFLPSRIPEPGVKKAPNPGSRIRIRNTDCMWFFPYFGSESGPTKSLGPDREKFRVRFSYFCKI